MVRFAATAQIGQQYKEEKMGKWFHDLEVQKIYQWGAGMMKLKTGDLELEKYCQLFQNREMYNQAFFVSLLK